MASLGTHIPIDCPVCSAPVNIPIRDLGAVGNELTIGLDFAPLHEHVANGHQSSGEAT